MALRLRIFTFILFVLVSSTWADKSQLIFQKAKKSYSQQRYSISLKILESHFDLLGPKTPTGAMVLGAWNNYHLRNYFRAQKIWAHLIRTRFDKINKAVVASYSKNQSTDFLPDDIPEKMLGYYFERYKNMVEYMIKQYDLLSAVTSKNLQDAIVMYKDILIENEIEEDEVEKLWEKLENYKTAREKVIFKNNWYVYTGLLSYKDKLAIKQPSGDVTNISSSSQGWCLGLGKQYENAFIRYAVEGCFGNQSTTVGTDDTNLNYFQKDVPAVTFMVTPKLSWRTPAQNSYIGLGTPLLYRKGDFTEPAGYEISDKTLISYGLTVHGEWKIQKYALFFQMGKIAKFSSALWLAGFQYHFD
ncbi:MAG: hypothetical protein GY909_07315 [Oligoflexia bacterium]|nr:hypothetical protein [Oligoflexia bacterium]